MYISRKKRNDFATKYKFLKQGKGLVDLADKLQLGDFVEFTSKNYVYNGRASAGKNAMSQNVFSSGMVMQIFPRFILLRGEYYQTSIPRFITTYELCEFKNRTTTII